MESENPTPEEEESYVDDEYDVDCILAETTVDGEPRYLIKWLNYDEPEHNTWEPRENILADEIVEQWLETKRRQARNLEPPFDLDRWRLQVERAQHDKAERNQRQKDERSSKRQATAPSENTDTDSTEAEDVSEDIEDDQGVVEAKKPQKAGFKKTNGIFRARPSQFEATQPQHDAKDNGSGVTGYAGTARPEAARTVQRRRRNSSSSSSEDEPLASKRPRVQASSSLSHSSLNTTRTTTTTRPSHTVLRASDTRGINAQRGMRTATRGGLTAGRAPRSLLAASANTNSLPRKFGFYRHQRKAELQSRSLADREPDLSVIGGLIDPSRKREGTSATTNVQQPENSVSTEIELFVPLNDNRPTDPNRPAREAVPGAWIEPPYQPLSKPIVDPNLATCFFWDRHQRNSSFAPCSADSFCRFLHRYERGVPVAAEPMSNSSGEYGEQKKTCYFWDYNLRTTGVATCIRGDNCAFDHFHDGNKLVASRPDGHVEAEVRPTCFFWDYNLRTKGAPSCSKGNDCTYDHFTARDKPVAMPPSDFRGEKSEDPQVLSNTRVGGDSSGTKKMEHQVPPPTYDQSYGYNAICHYWFEGTSCDRDTCKYVHHNEPGLPIGPRTRKLNAPETNKVLMTDSLGSSNSEVSAQDLAELERRKSRQTERTRADTSGHHPTDPYALTCWFWHQGACSKGSDCTYFHCYVPSGKIAPPPPSRFGKATSDSYRPTAGANSPMHVKTTEFQANPSDSHDALVARTGWSMSNTYQSVDENLPPSLNGSISSLDQRVDIPRTETPLIQTTRSKEGFSRVIKTGKMQIPCRFWSSGFCEYTAEKCNALHTYRENIHLNEDTYVPLATPSSRFAPVTWINGRKKIMKPCKFWEGDGCFKTSDECDFLHYIPDEEFDAPQQSSKTSNTVRINQERSNANLDIPHIPTALDIVSRARPGSEPVVPTFTEGEYFADEPLHIPDDSALTTVSSGTSKIQWNPEANQDKSTTEDRDETATTMSQINSRTKRISMSEYRQRPQAVPNNPRIKEFFFAGSRPLSVDLGNLMKQDNLKVLANELSGLTKLRFDSLCMAMDVKTHIASGHFTKLWTSNFVPLNLTDASITYLNKAYADLDNRHSAMAAIASIYVIVVHPYTMEWECLASDDGERTDATQLRLAVLQCKENIQKPAKMKPLIESKEGVPINSLIRKTLVKQILGMEFKNLWHPLDTPIKRYRAFLMFPPGSETERFLLSWLYASCSAEILTTFNCHVEGSWNLFNVHRKDEAQLLLVHESMTVELSRLPGLAEYLKKPSLQIRSISDSDLFHPLHKSHQAEEENLLGMMHNTLLAPHGQCILITPSFVVSEPRKVEELIDFFFGSGGRGKRSWKLCVCHNFADFVLDVAVTKVNEKNDFEKQHRDKPSREQMVEDKGLDFTTCKARFALHAKLISLETKGLMRLKRDDAIDEDDSPVVYAPEFINPNDEIELVDWFASWALQHFDTYRRFTVVGSSGDPRQRARLWRMLENSDYDAVRRSSSLIPVTQNPAHDEPSRDLVPPDRSPWQDSPSYSPRVAFQLPARGASVSKTASPHLTDSSPADPGSRRGSLTNSPADGSGWQEVSQPRKEYSFQPTSAWYDLLRQQGRGHEHVQISSWRNAFLALGMKAA